MIVSNTFINATAEFFPNTYQGVRKIVIIFMIKINSIIFYEQKVTEEAEDDDVWQVQWEFEEY